MTTYASEVMTKAHELYRASDGTGRDLFAACLSVAHAMIKERRAYRATVNSIMEARRARITSHPRHMMKIAA